MQAPLLPKTADLPPGAPPETVATIIGVRAVLSQLLHRIGDTAAAFDGLAAALQGVQGETVRDVQQLHFVHLSLKALSKLHKDGLVRASCPPL